MRKSAQDEPVVVVGKTYDLLLWLLPKAEKFPRSYRFSIGDRVVGRLALNAALRSGNKVQWAGRELASDRLPMCWNAGG